MRSIDTINEIYIICHTTTFRSAGNAARLAYLYYPNFFDPSRWRGIFPFKPTA